MYRSILVPLDGTQFGEHALAPALAIARRTSARLHLVHVHVSSLPVPMDAVPATASLREHELEWAADRAYVDSVVERIRRRSRVMGVPAEATLLDGPVARSLAEQAVEARVDLVVMSTHGHTGLARLWHHGVAAHLTRRLSVPVLMVRGDGSPADLEHQPDFQHVLVPLGGAPWSEQVLEHALELGSPFGARYTLLKAVAPPAEPGYTLLGTDGAAGQVQLQARRDEALRYLDRVAARLRPRALDVETEVVAGSGVAAAIQTFVQRAGSNGARVDAVAMETQGMGGAAHLFTPGVTEQVVAHSRVPVLVHHAHPAAATRPIEDSAAGKIWMARRTAAA